MMKYIFGLVLLLTFWLCSAQGQITPKHSTSCLQPTPSNAFCTDSTAGLVVNAGDTIVLFQNTGVSTNDTYTPSDSCGQSWTPGNTAGANQFIRWWYVLSANAGTCKITVTQTYTGTNQSYFAWTAQTYSGVQSIGANTGVQSTASITTCSGFLQVTHPGDFIVGGFTRSGSGSSPYTLTSGTLRVANTGSLVYNWIIDNTSSIVENVSMGISWTGTAVRCSYALVELVGVPGGRIAAASDAMAYVLLNNAGNNNYLLPANLLTNPSTWCTWVMPTGAVANTYQLVPQSTNLNGQTSSITMPSWEATRLCQDSSGYYWTNPPLLAGNGITIAPSPTGVVISATTPTGGSVTKIAGGTTTLGNGSVAIPPNSCTQGGTWPGDTVTAGATNVQTGDVVTHSRQSTPSGWGNGSLTIVPQAFSGSIFFSVCNSSANAITPSALPVNYLVVR